VLHDEISGVDERKVQMAEEPAYPADTELAGDLVTIPIARVFAMAPGTSPTTHVCTAGGPDRRQYRLLKRRSRS
jgi:hypothetical protein